LKSGKAIETALKEKGLKVITLDADENIAENLKKERIDLVFIALHGKYGEDGTVQGLLELLDIPYTGSGVLASALALNKILAKKVFKAEGVTTPEILGWGTRPPVILGDPNIKTQIPVVVKPVSQGSTLGVSIVRKESELENALKKAFEYDEEAFVEKYIQGTEVTVSILGNENPQILPLIEIIPQSGFYDYEAKYIPGKSKHIIPPRLPGEYCRLAGEMALKAHLSLRCRGFSRVEVIVDTEGTPYILDVNTIPGMTEISLYPESSRAAGIEFGDLCLKLLELALEKHKK
jgi:D-alanine-D-alanine ligase